MNHTNGRVNYGCIYENGFEPEEVGPDLTFDAFNDDIPLENTGLETDSCARISKGKETFKWNMKSAGMSVIVCRSGDGIGDEKFAEMGNVEQSWRRIPLHKSPIDHQDVWCYRRYGSKDQSESRNKEKIEFLKRLYLDHIVDATGWNI
ncbi:hypothetical protein F8M41_019792 [Gigaspora margarita]|uniref:Uncharacterized protein n=1 Tax=Gigaspora margarita TaxID=4874 RepID=A0A8H4AJE8_GIGMA|nr:hypothetical protein F8M41_019792 [Gigaspora margarita]